MPHNCAYHRVPKVNVHNRLMCQFDFSWTAQLLGFLVRNLQVQRYHTLLAILFQRYQVIVPFHSLYWNCRTVELLCTLFLHFLYLRFVAFVLIFSKHVSGFILEVFDIVSVFLDFKRVPEGEVWAGFCDFVGFEDIGVGIFFIGLDKSQVFGHFFNVDGYGFIVNEFFVDGEDVSGLVGEL